MAFPDLLTIINNISQQMPVLWRVVSGGVFLTGLFFALKSVYLFKEYGEMRVMMSSNTDVRKPLGFLIIGAILMYAPFVAGQILRSLFDQSQVSPITYLSGISGQAFKETFEVMGNIIEFIGFIAFVRGWIIISHTTQQQSQPGSFAKGLIHIIGGVFAINIWGTFKVLQATIGWKTGG